MPDTKQIVDEQATVCHVAKVVSDTMYRARTNFDEAFHASASKLTRHERTLAVLHKDTVRALAVQLV